MLPNQVTLVDNHIANNLRQFRLIAGISQDELGALVGVTFQQIQKYEKAKNRISASRLFEFSQILSRSVADFFEGAEPESGLISNKAKKYQILFDSEVESLIKAFSRIDNSQSRKSLISLVNSIAKSGVKKVKHSYS